MIYTSEAPGFCDAISSCAPGSPTSPLSSREPALSQCVHLFTARSLEPIPQDLEGRDISCRAALHLPPHTRRSAKGLASVGELSHPPSLHAAALPKVRREEIQPSSVKSIFATSSITRPGCKEALYFGRPRS